MAVTLEGLPLRMKVLSKDYIGGVGALMKRAALTADQAVVTATPVDTGLARSNWLVSQRTPRKDIIPPYNPGRQQGLGESANATGAINQGVDALANYEPGDDIFIANNVPYIPLLNEGSSAQAGAHYVERGVVAAVESVRNDRVFVARII